MSTPEHEAARLRFMAAIQDKVAEGRVKYGLPAEDVIAEARRLRVQADLIEQGVPMKGKKI